MYENENKNMNGLGNENMEHRDVPETTVNWTIPGDERNRQGQNTQGHRTMDPEARSQETQGQYSQARYSQAQEGQGSREQHREQHTQGPDAAFGSYGSPAARTAMAEILIRDIREVVISSAITPIKDDLLKERQELQRQRSSSEPYQAGS